MQWSLMIKIKSHININTIKYISISYINVGLNVLINLFLINKLSSYNFGKISIGKTIFQSFEFSHIGIRNGFDRLFPSMEKNIEINEYFTVGLITTFISSLCFVFFWSVYKFESLLFYFFFIIAGVIYSLITLYRIYYRSIKDKQKFVSLSFFSILLPPIAEIIGFLVFGIKGYIIGFLFAYIVVLIIVHKKYTIRLIFKRDRFFSILKKILDKGWLLFLTGLVAFFSTSADRFLIENYWGLEAVGRFSIIMFIFSVFGMFPVNYTEMIMSKIISSRSLKYTFQHMFFIFAFMIILVGIIYFLLPFLVKIFINKYIADIPLMRIIIFATVPYSMRSVIYYYMHAIDKREILFFIDLFTTILYFIGLFYTLKNTTSFENIIYLKVGFYSLSILLTVFSAIKFSKKINQ